jgi:hypothetical protein
MTGKTSSQALAAALAAIADPQSCPEYRRLKDAEAAVSAAAARLRQAEAVWMTLVKPAVDEQRGLSGRCQADRDGDCSWCGCPQLRDGEPKKTGRCCPLPHGDED